MLKIASNALYILLFYDIHLPLIYNRVSLVYHPYTIRTWLVCTWMSFACYSYGVRMSLLCTRLSSACHLHVNCILSVSHSHAGMYSHATCMSLIFARMSLVSRSYVQFYHERFMQVGIFYRFLWETSFLSFCAFCIVSNLIKPSQTL